MAQGATRAQLTAFIKQAEKFKDWKFTRKGPNEKVKTAEDMLKRISMKLNNLVAGDGSIYNDSKPTFE